ncbi:uncharacterized protein LOC124363548 [Homalodisca vitripennis]|uniref:uncharacterized protein LOC124363548 n=1 Tax=Homalodisca vitripennis TaxID=197043 RepID=UPI001EEB71B0|nr:uncharacterized protein LOC124363548 [Homalodisca vitripennis]
MKLLEIGVMTPMKTPHTSLPMSRIVRKTRQKRIHNQKQSSEKKERGRRRSLRKREMGLRNREKTKNQDKDFSPPWRTGPFNPTPLTIAQPAYLPIDSDDWTAEQWAELFPKVPFEVNFSQ